MLKNFPPIPLRIKSNTSFWHTEKESNRFTPDFIKSNGSQRYAIILNYIFSEIIFQELCSQYEVHVSRT